MPDRITTRELWERLGGEHRPMLVETLGAAYWADAHLPGALNIPAKRIDDLAQRMLPDLDAEIVVYSSRTDRTSVAAAQRFVALGYRNVLVYESGKEEWIEFGLPVERDVDPA